MCKYANVQMGLLPLRALYSLRPLRENKNTNLAMNLLPEPALNFKP